MRFFFVFILGLLNVVSVASNAVEVSVSDSHSAPFFPSNDELTDYALLVQGRVASDLSSVGSHRPREHVDEVLMIPEQQDFVVEDFIRFKRNPTATPTKAPSRKAPTTRPTKATPMPSSLRVPTAAPSTTAPTVRPTRVPSFRPTKRPTTRPTEAPSDVPTVPPTDVPTAAPTVVPILIGGERLAISDSVVAAVRSGDASGVTGAELRQALYTAMDTLANAKNKTVTAMFSYPNGTRVKGLSWDPSHDSMAFTITDTSSTFTVYKSNKDYGMYPESSSQSIAVAGFSKWNSRYIAMGSNPFAVPGNAALNAASIRMISWLNKGVDPRSGLFNVTIAHIPGASSYWFSHDIPTRAWFRSTYPSARVNAINSCENTDLANCLATSNLLVIGRQVGKADDTAAPFSTFDSAAVSTAIQNFMKRGGSVLYVHYYRDGNAMTDMLFPMLGLASPAVGSLSNYFRRSGLLNYDPIADANAPTTVNPLRSLLDTLSGVTPVLSSDLASCRAGTWLTRIDAWHNCQTASFKAKLATGALSLRSTLNGLDNAGSYLFNSTAAVNIVTKLFVLLGDKYRTAGGVVDVTTPVTRYPLNLTDNVRFAGAVFGDVSVLYSRTAAPAQDDLGSLYCTFQSVYRSNCRGTAADHKVFGPRVLVLDNQLVEQPVEFPVNVWTSTGYFALPGRTIKVTRLDNRADVKVSIYFWYQRDGSTKSLYSSDGVRTSYVRPSFVKSTDIPVTAAGNLVTAPFGGPIYLLLTRVSNVAAGSGPVRVVFDNVGKHSAVLDVGNSTQLSILVNQITRNPIPILDIKSPGLEIHMRKDYLTGSLKVIDFMMDYSGSQGVSKILYDLRFNFLEKQMSLAGFKAPGKTLRQSLSAGDLAMCGMLGWNCTDASIHIYNGIQHANYDDYAVCGSGCSGNPFDMDWTITPVGWGESHELGHNMQVGLLNINYAAWSGNKDAWSSYSNRAGENSNNIFPYHMKWNYYRNYLGYTGTITGGWTGHKDTFALLQSGLARTNATINGVSRRVVLYMNCKIRKDYPLTTPVAQVLRESIYADNSYAADNDQRMSFYLQIFMLLTNRPLRNGMSLTNGFDIVTLLYQNARFVYKYSSSDAVWNARRASLGFDLFNRTCASTTRCYSTYGSSSVSSMPGNDFILVTLTFITGYDFRPYFDIRGVPYSTLANEQVSRHIASGVASLGPIPTDFYALSDYPSASLTGATTVPLDGKSAWPGTNWTPASCVNPRY